MSHPISLTSEHLITSVLLQRVQMGVPNRTNTNWREALIGCLWLSGRWSRVIILSLGEDMLMSYLVHFSPLFPPSVFLLFIASHLRIQLPISQLQLPATFFSLLICHFLVLNFQIWWTQAAIVWHMTDLIQMTVGGSNISVLLDTARYKERHANSNRVISMYISSHIRINLHK